MILHLPGEPDRAEYLNVLVRCGDVRFGAIRLGHRCGGGCFFGFLGQCPGGVQDRCIGSFCPAKHFGKRVLDGLEGTNRLSECHAFFRVVNRARKSVLQSSGALGGQNHQQAISDPRPKGPVISHQRLGDHAVKTDIADLPRNVAPRQELDFNAALTCIHKIPLPCTVQFGGYDQEVCVNRIDYK